MIENPNEDALILKIIQGLNQDVAVPARSDYWDPRFEEPVPKYEWNPYGVGESVEGMFGPSSTFEDYLISKIIGKGPNMNWNKKRMGKMGPSSSVDAVMKAISRTGK
jgi:hypothetical protein